MNIKKIALSIALTISTHASTANISSAKELPVESGSIAPVKTYNANTVTKSSKIPNKNTPTLIASQYLGAGDMDFCFDISTQQQSQECLPSITREILYMPSRPPRLVRFIIKNSYYYYYFYDTKKPDTALTTALLNSNPNADKAVYVRAKNESGFARAWRTSVSDFNGRPTPAIGFVIEKRP